MPGLQKNLWNPFSASLNGLVRSTTNQYGNSSKVLGGRFVLLFDDRDGLSLSVTAPEVPRHPLRGAVVVAARGTPPVWVRAVAGPPRSGVALAAATVPTAGR